MQAMLSSASFEGVSNLTRSSLPFPKREEFKHLIAEEKWDELIWLPYSVEHAEEGVMLLEALAKDKVRLADWIKHCGTRLGHPGVRTRLDVVRRLVTFVNLTPGLVMGNVMNISIALRLLQEILIRNEFIQELEVYRETLGSCFHSMVKTDRTRTQLRSSELLWNCLSYVRHYDDNFDALYDHITNMYSKDEASRARFMYNCKRECELLILLAEAACGPTEGSMALHYISSCLITVASILTASRFSSPFASNGLVLVPIPVELSSDAHDWFRRIFRLCWKYKAFTLSSIYLHLLPPLRSLPEFWVSSQGLPLSKLAELIWDKLNAHDQQRLKSDPRGAQVEYVALQVACVALRHIAYAAQHDPSVLDRVEAWMVARIDPAVFEEARVGAGNAVAVTTQSRTPALALLISEVIEASVAHRTRDDDDEDPEEPGAPYRMHMDLFQSVLLMTTGTAAGSSLLYESMTVCDCAALRSFGEHVATSVAEARSLANRGSDQKDEASCRILGCILIEIRATLNLLERILRHNEIVRRFLPMAASAFVPAILQAIRCVESIESWEAADLDLAKVHKDLGALWPALCLHTAKSSALCVLVVLCTDGLDNAIVLNPEMVNVLFNACLKSLPCVEEASLALLALARAVDPFEDNWAVVQKYVRDSGNSLSSLCTQLCIAAAHDKAQDFRWIVEALATFQYMAEDGDDDGTREVWEVIKSTSRSGRLHLLPISICVNLVMRFFDFSDSIIAVESNFDTVGWAFQLLGNYAANISLSNRNVLEGSEAEAHHLLFEWGQVLINAYLRQPQKMLVAHLKTTVECCFALASLAGLPYPHVKALLLPEAREMALVLERIKLDEHAASGELLYEFAETICRAVMNVTPACAGNDKRDLEMLATCIGSFNLTGIVPAYWDHNPRIFALLALHNFIRNSPDRKWIILEAGFGDILLSALGKIVAPDHPLACCIQIVLGEVMKNNPRASLETRTKFEEALKRLPKPEKSLREATRLVLTIRRI